jgi:hypothetical protein
MKIDNILLGIFQGISNEIFWAINVNNFQLARWCFLPGITLMVMDLITDSIMHSGELNTIKVLVFIILVGVAGLFNILSKKEEEKWKKDEKWIEDGKRRHKENWNIMPLRVTVLIITIDVAIMFKTDITGEYFNVLFSTVLCALYFLACIPSTNREDTKAYCS